MDHPTQRLDSAGIDRAQSEQTRRLDDGSLCWGEVCAKCYSEMTWAHVHLDGPKAQLLYLENLRTVHWEAPTRCLCLALVCTACGYIELYTHNPQALIEQP